MCQFYSYNLRNIAILIFSPLAMGAPIVAEGNERIAKGGRSAPANYGWGTACYLTTFKIDG